MSSRKNADSTSQNGVAFAAGNPALPSVKNINYSQNFDTGRKLVKNGGFPGNPVEVYADNGVWDTVLNRFLFPGSEYNPGDLQRS